METVHRNDTVLLGTQALLTSRDLGRENAPSPRQIGKQEHYGTMGVLLLPAFLRSDRRNVNQNRATL